MDLLSSERLRPSDTDKRRKDGDLKFDYRLPLESDYGRLVFSSSFRRLHDKTQVFPLTTNDNIHSRLTHSIEVASVGKSFALNIVQDKEVCEALGLNYNNLTLWRSISTLLELICLAHDIGNPPLGHFGETAIKCYFTDLFDSVKLELERCGGDHDLLKKSKNAIIRSEIDNNGEISEFFIRFFNGGEPLAYDYTKFDGNAQGFRVITKLQFLNDLYGLNLTSASLASFIKYPNCGNSNKKGYIGEHKHGVFCTEKDYLDSVMKNCGITSRGCNVYNRHPFSFLMEAADTICYLLMDLEDAIGKGWLSYYDFITILKSHKDGKKIVEDAGNHFLENDQPKKKVVQLRTELMGYLVRTAWENFARNCRTIISGEYKEELLYEDKDSLASILHNYSQKRVYSNVEIENLELTGDAVITGLLDKYVKYLFHPEAQYRLHGKHIISRSIFMTTLQEHLNCFGNMRKAWNEYENFDPKDLFFEEKLRIIRDHVACMTDTYALEQYRKLSGEKI
jgi:dGTPase